MQLDSGSIPGLGRSPGEGNGNPLQYSCLENPMDRGGWSITVHGVAKSQTWPSSFTFFHFSISLDTLAWNTFFMSHVLISCGNLFWWNQLGKLTYSNLSTAYFCFFFIKFLWLYNISTGLSIYNMHKYIDIKYIKQLDLSYNYFMAQRMPLTIPFQSDYYPHIIHFSVWGCLIVKVNFYGISQS